MRSVNFVNQGASRYVVGHVEHYDQKNENAPSVNLFKKFIQSDKWSKALQVNDFLSL